MKYIKSFQIELDRMINKVMVEFQIGDDVDTEMSKRVRYEVGKYGSDPEISAPEYEITYDLFSDNSTTINSIYVDVYDQVYQREVYTPM